MRKKRTDSSKRKVKLRSGIWESKTKVPTVTGEDERKTMEKQSSLMQHHRTLLPEMKLGYFKSSESLGLHGGKRIECNEGSSSTSCGGLWEEVLLD